MQRRQRLQPSVTNHPNPFRAAMPPIKEVASAIGRKCRGRGRPPSHPGRLRQGIAVGFDAEMRMISGRESGFQLFFTLHGAFPLSGVEREPDELRWQQRQGSTSSHSEQRS